MSYNRESRDRMILRNGRSDGGEIIASFPPPSLMGEPRHVMLSRCHGGARHRASRCIFMMKIAANVN